MKILMQRTVLIAAAWLLIALPATPADSFLAHWQRHDADSSRRVDHAVWDRLVQTYIRPVDGVNLFAYSEVPAPDREALAAYLERLQQVSVSALNQDEQRAYWVNLYNALTIKVILDHYPVDSIQDISFRLLARGPWSQPLVEVAGFELSLDDIEHRILRPVFKDNRIHYAVNCASIGCPNLQPRAFTADNWEALFVRGAREYVNHPRAVSLQANRLVLSGIYEWYYDDFAETDADLIRHIKQFADAPLAERLTAEVEIEDYHYDWSLNGTPD